ncbi:hypothetical protein VKT23_009576 [Stygiomarasmius scandens]|uniref:ABM domain-containing protein n=1 Tax=Marasmiellus scandens TaxID=2682957 RepID=A0ABR1JGJ8_9AGAR
MAENLDLPPEIRDGVQALPDRTSSGKLMVIANITVKPGKEALFEKLAIESKLSANSDKEPGTHTYRLTRVFNNDNEPMPGKYILIEEYAGKAGLLLHLQTVAQQAYTKAAGDMIDSMNVDIVDEF